MEDMLIGTDSDFVCPSLGSWPHPDLCELYYTCYYQEPPYLWQCRQTFLYDQNQKECISAELVDCGDRVSPSSELLKTYLWEPFFYQILSFIKYILR